MRPGYIIISNNPALELAATDIYLKEFGVLAVLERVRDLVHLGHQLLTHPFAGSVKPCENPYRSIAISFEQKNLDYQSETIIASCLESARVMLKESPYRLFSEEVLADLALIDKSLLAAGLESLRKQT